MSSELEAAIAHLNSDDEDRQQQAWGLVYEFLNPQLRSIWRGWGGLSSDEGADIVGETWTRVWKASVNGQLPTNAAAFRQYVARTSENLLRDGYRRSVRRESLSLESAETSGALQEILSEDESAGEMDVSEAEAAALRRAVLERLPPADAELYRLYVDGLSPSEISAALNLGRNAVDARISRLRKRLRTMAEAMRLHRHLSGADGD